MSKGSIAVLNKIIFYCKKSLKLGFDDTRSAIWSLFVSNIDKVAAKLFHIIFQSGNMVPALKLNLGI